MPVDISELPEDPHQVAACFPPGAVAICRPPLEFKDCGGAGLYKWRSPYPAGPGDQAFQSFYGKGVR